MAQDPTGELGAGDESSLAALGALYDATVPTVFGFVRSRCGDDDLAEDITAETFVAAARKFRAGRGVEVSEAWLITVARRRLIDHWRHLSVSDRRLRLLAEPQADSEADRLGQDVLEALASLPERQRAALTLRYLDELSVAEIAHALGLTYRAAESLLARARRSMRTAMEASS